MVIPKECKMPDLSGLDFHLIGPLLIQFLIGEPGLSQKARLYRRNFVRLVEKALREYHEARGVILAQIAEANRPAKEMKKHGRQIFMVQFTDHIETCINATARLFKLLERIKSEREAPAFPKDLRRLVETKSEPITNVRDAVEHIDEQIQNGEIAPGKPIALAVTRNDDGVMIADYEIKFEELAMVLKKMHEIAQYILTIKKMEAL
jgi:hypothetical protein